MRFDPQHGCSALDGSARALCRQQQSLIKLKARNGGRNKKQMENSLIRVRYQTCMRHRDCVQRCKIQAEQLKQSLGFCTEKFTTDLVLGSASTLQDDHGVPIPGKFKCECGARKTTTNCDRW